MNSPATNTTNKSTQRTVAQDTHTAKVLQAFFDTGALHTDVYLSIQ